MPIQETLTGITFPAPTMNVNTIPTPLQYLGSLLALWLEGDVGETAIAGPSAAVTASAIAANVGTLTVAASGNFAVGQPVTFAALTNATALNGTFPVASLPTATTITVAVTAANVSSAAEASATVTGLVASAWADQSGNGRSLVPYQLNPAIITSSQNGKAGLISVNGTANVSPFLVSAYAAALDFLATTPFSVVVAYKPAADNFTYDGILGNALYAASSCQGWMVGHSVGTTLKPTLRLISNKATAECSVSTTVALAAGTPYIVQFVNSGTGTAAGISIYVNNVLQANTVLYDNLAGAVTQNSSRGVAAPAVGTGGANGGSRSTLFEAFVVTKALSARDVQLMDAYLNAKWAIHA